MGSDQDTGRPVEEVLRRIEAAKTKAELDALRPVVVESMHSDGTEAGFHRLQDAFRVSLYRLEMMEHPAGRAILDRIQSLEEQVRQLTKERDAAVLDAAAEKTLRERTEDQHRQYAEGHAKLERQWEEVNRENRRLRKAAAPFVALAEKFPNHPTADLDVSYVNPGTGSLKVRDLYALKEAATLERINKEAVLGGETTSP